MEKQTTLPPLTVGDSEGSHRSGLYANTPTPTVRDVVKGLKQQALTLCQIGLSEFDPCNDGQRFQGYARLVTAIYEVANDVEVSL
jgi:hypothetical protein